MTVSTDRPIAKFDQDLFGYGQLAIAIASGIANRSDLKDGYVVGIEGAWGMGKTSVANLIATWFDDWNARNPQVDRRVHVVRFSPWLYSTFAALSVTYMGELSKAIHASFAGELGGGAGEIFRPLMHRFGALIGATAGLAAAGAGVASGVPGASAVGGPTKDAVTALLNVEEASTEELAGGLRDKLGRLSKGQLVVVVDDIDRLHADEMRQLLTVVKTFGDLPRVVHLLLYDRRIVDRATESSLKTGELGGPTYIEKIVQLPAALPVVESANLRDYLFSRLEAIAGSDSFDRKRLRDWWRDALRDLLTTPRDVTRLANALVVAWPGISDHADLVDFATIEALRLSEPRAWEALREDRAAMVGVADRANSKASKPRTDKIAALGPPTRHASLLHLLNRLFPLAGGNDRVDRAALRKRRAIGVPEHVDAYFRYQPGASLGRSELHKLLSAVDEGTAGKALRSLATDQGRLRRVLEDLCDRADELTGAQVEASLSALHEAADDLLDVTVAEPPCAADHDTATYLGATMASLVERVPVADCEAVVLKLVENPNAFSASALLMRDLKQDHSALLGEEALRKIAKKMAATLMAHRDDLARTPLLGPVLHAWTEVDGGFFSATHTAEELLKTDVGLVRLCDSIMGVSMTGRAITRKLISEPDGFYPKAYIMIARGKSALASESFLDAVEETRRLIYREIVSTFVAQAEGLIARSQKASDGPAGGEAPS